MFNININIHINININIVRAARRLGRAARAAASGGTAAPILSKKCLTRAQVIGSGSGQPLNQGPSYQLLATRPQVPAASYLAAGASLALPK